MQLNVFFFRGAGVALRKRRGRGFVRYSLTPELYELHILALSKITNKCGYLVGSAKICVYLQINAFVLGQNPRPRLYLLALISLAQGLNPSPILKFLTSLKVYLSSFTRTSIGH